MQFVHRCTAMVVMVVWLLSAPCAMADLSAEDAAFNRTRTEEWEKKLGDYLRWNDYKRALYAHIYSLRAGDYFNDKWNDFRPKFPAENVMTYDQALELAKSFLCEYEPLITREYLAPMRVASCYYDYWESDPIHTITRTEHVQMWCIQFWEISAAGEWVVRAAAYIDAHKGRVAMIDLGLDCESDKDDLETYQIFE